MEGIELLEHYKRKRAHFSRLVSKLEIMLAKNENKPKTVKFKIIECVKKDDKIQITDHIILKYLDRVSGVDINQVRKIILDIVGRKSKLSDFKIIKDGYLFIIADRIVVTVYKNNTKFVNFKNSQISKREKNKINLQNYGGFC